MTARYSVVVPVYGNAESLSACVERIAEIEQQLGEPVEAVFVVDGSPDDSLARLQELLPSASFESQLLVHSRNFGSFAALRTGIMAATGEWVATMAADLQEPGSLVVDSLRAVASGDADVAVGTRLARRDAWFARTMSNTFWSAFRRFVLPQMPKGGVDMFAVNRRAAEVLTGLQESHTSLVGQLIWMGFRRVEVPYERLRREHGRSGWTFRMKLRYLLDSVYSFSSLPISAILWIGALGALLATVAGIAVFIAYVAGAIGVPGYTALMLVVLFSSGAILVALGVVGTYVWRTYENTKARPTAIVRARGRYGGSVQP